MPQHPRSLRRLTRALLTLLTAVTGHAAAASYCTAIYATAAPGTSGATSKHQFLNTISGTVSDYGTIDDSKVTGTTGPLEYNASAINPVNGALYYVERTTGTLLSYNPATRVTTKVTQNTNLRSNTDATGIGFIIGAAIEETGNMYVYSSFGWVSIFNTATGTQVQAPRKITFPSGFTPATNTNGDIVLGANNQLYILVEGVLNGGASGSHLIPISDTLVAGTPVPIKVGGVATGGFNGMAIEPFRVQGNTTIIAETFYLSSGTNLYRMGADGAATSIYNQGQNITDLASCNVVPARPTLKKEFDPPFLTGAGGISRLTITVGNDNSGPIALYTDLVDPLPSSPAQMTFAPNPNPSGTCGNAQIQLSNSPPELRIKAGSYIPVGGCVLQVNVTVPVPGTYQNVILGSTVVTSANVIQEEAKATLYDAVRVSKTFSPANLLPGQTTVLSVTLTNGNSAPTKVATLTLEDRIAETTGLPGLTLGAVTGNSCGGSVSVAGGVLKLTGGTLGAGGSCVITLPVTLGAATASGKYTNVIQPTQVSATFNDGVRDSGVNGAASATADLTVAPFALVSSAVRTTQSPATVTNPHRLTPGVTGPVTFTLTPPAGSRMTYLLWYDVNGDGQVDPADQAVVPAGQTTGTLNVTGSFPTRPDGTPADVNLLVQVLVPPGLAQGVTEVLTLGARQTVGGTVRTATLTDTTIVGQSGGTGGSLNLSKLVRNITAGGAFSLNASTGGVGEVLEYCVNYLNQGVGTLSEVVMTDPVPFFTAPQLDGYLPGQGVRWVRGVAAQPGQTATPGTDSNNLTSAADTDPGSLSVTPGRLSVVIGTLAGGEQGTVCYRVKIR
ncbi:hypothetical protein GCM10008959_19950 [Deinococcus seoulensis]|uniref:DUF7933 domain-containing protein n=1 Tax=Deinococcus seoulensis TaxID=1837379 RepID=A0ABQ2RSV0_9DEIO|nr:hypothetical protein [Deinococcus seoulensis]GGR58198.1 hypothetical protein GCM10008959_19950 [Deinococcus seoulensis]